MDQAARDWATSAVKCRPGTIRVGYFGSYARGNWGVGSDLDLVAISESASEPFECRSLSWDLSRLPVPAQLLVYTLSEWQLLLTQGGRFARTYLNGYTPVNFSLDVSAAVC